MARLFTCGFDSQQYASDGLTSFGPLVTYDTSLERSGLACLKLDTGATPSATNITILSTYVNTSTGYARSYFLFTALPTSTVGVLASSVSATTGIFITSTGTLQLQVAGVQVGSDTAALTMGVWYRLELFWDLAPASGSRTWTARLNGTQIGTMSTSTINGPMTVVLGWQDGAAAGTNKVLYIDDVAVNDNTGANQNSWPGEGRVTILKPISDNARATLWTGGAGGTTNLWDAVDNTPPVGTAAETNTTQIEHAGGAAGTTDAYDANMQSYNAVGIGPNDTVSIVQCVACHGEDVGTGTKLLNFEVVSNPAIASSGNVTAGFDGGALSTFPTLWGTSFGTVSYAPSVTNATSPVMRVRRPETATRVASVAYMALIVEYVQVHSFLPELVTAPQIALQRAP